MKTLLVKFEVAEYEFHQEGEGDIVDIYWLAILIQPQRCPNS